MSQATSKRPPDTETIGPGPAEPAAPVSAGLAVLGSAAYGGVLVTIGLSLGRYWLTISPQDYASQFDQIFEFLLPAIAITLLPAAAGVALSLRRSWRTPRRSLWLTAAFALAVSLAITALYHVPANNRIWSDTITADEIDTELPRWLLWHALRTVAGLTAAIAAFWATVTGAGGSSEA